MAMPEATPADEILPDHADRPGRRRPFTTWVKKLAHFKNNGSSDGRTPGSKRHLTPIKIAPKKRGPTSKKNNPYPLSGYRPATDGGISSSTHHSLQGSSQISYTTRAPPTVGALSMAPTVSTERRSMLAPSNGAASSVTGTTIRTLNGYSSRRGGDSTFSSPAPSLQSLATTLTTIQSLQVPGGAGGGAHHGHGGTSLNGFGSNAGNGTVSSVGFGSLHTHHATPSAQMSVLFHQPFPNTPASAIPSHLAAPGSGHPTTYSTATANNLLTDNASILTLASSSKRRRRRSLDTDASVRALAPSSLFGGSRESLPLSVLSANIDGGNGGGGSSMPTATGMALHGSGSRMSVAERTSIYSTTGILGDRSSFYARGGSAVAAAEPVALELVVKAEWIVADEQKDKDRTQ
ncbi:hypothetical protein CMQ_6688 [Grosmannia clavigera kw1407]|uniref:Ca2+-modulated nonselective cation channel polycystin n=1 Tax=Grosmannia clavigera (strain kw1407 / UAMH 11150) TaxID=655863 RepID=F0X6X4_GROCL|nr:uncharacterized protein CMQ_6688 [Grosmannia clavigera kw1407]EFX06367.1 hypothetical protein CMQ_6688 [Grosmannia clavigera kw1407]